MYEKEAPARETIFLDIFINAISKLATNREHINGSYPQVAKKGDTPVVV